MATYIPDTTTPVHHSVTLERVLELHNRRATTLDDPGVCLACGFEAGGVEPDAHDVECESCGEPAVLGIEDAVLLFI